MSAAELLREIVRLYAREQRRHAKCGDGGSTVRCHVLTELYREEGQTQQALAERLGLDKGWISRAVDALATEGCIERRPNERDRRCILLSLTGPGRARAARLERDLNQHAAQLLERLPGDRHPQMQESLQLILKALSGPRNREIASTALTLRPALDRDWAAIEHLLRTEGLPLDGALDHLVNFVVGEVAGRVVCSAGLETYDEHALLRSVVVAPSDRGKGRGKQLVAYMLEQAAMHGVAHLYLLTTSAASFFAELGFEPVNRALLPDALQLSRELQGACPASATAMAMKVPEPSNELKSPSNGLTWATGNSS